MKGYAVGFVLVSLYSRAQTADQQNTSAFDNSFVIEYTQSLGQSFRPSVNGQLAAVDLNLARNTSQSGTIHFQIRPVLAEGTNLDPATLGAALFSSDYSFDLIGATYSPVHFAMGNGPTLAVDQPYIMLLSTDHPDGNGGIDPVAWNFSLNNPYNRGQGYLDRSNLIPPRAGWTSFGGGDFGFQTFMTEVPEPSTIAFALVGTAVFAATHWRRRGQTALHTLP